MADQNCAHSGCNCKVEQGKGVFKGGSESLRESRIVRCKSVPSSLGKTSAFRLYGSGFNNQMIKQIADDKITEGRQTWRPSVTVQKSSYGSNPLIAVVPPLVRIALPSVAVAPIAAPPIAIVVVVVPIYLPLVLVNFSLLVADFFVVFARLPLIALTELAIALPL